MFSSASGTFAATSGAMALSRSGHAAALLQDGSVLIAGGYNGNFLASAEVYAPQADSFRVATGAMTTGRLGATATVLSDGRVLIVGGFNGSVYLNSAELYDPATETFTSTTGTMVAARLGHTATLLSDGKVLIAGGQNPDYLNSAEIYDPATGNFTKTTGDLAAARNGHTATLLQDGKVLIAGGYNGSYLNSAEIYDPASGRFSATSGSMTTARNGHSASLLPGGTVLIAGGYNGSYLDSAEVYNPSGGSFTAQSSPMTAVRQLHSATVLSDGRVLIAGGQNDSLLTFDVNRDPSDNVSPNIVFSADSKVGFAPYTGSGVVLAFSPETGEGLKRIQTGGRPAFATPLGDGKTLAVVSVWEDKIFLIDMEALELRTTYTLSGAQFGFGSILSLAPDGRTGYISSTGTGEVLKVDLSDGRVVARLGGLEGPAQVTISPDGAVLLVVDTLSEELVFADASSMTRKQTLKVREHVTTADLTIFNKAVFGPDGDSGIIAARDIQGSLYSGTAFVFKIATGEMLDMRTVGSLPGFTAVTPDGRSWVILNEFSLSLVPTSNPESLLEIPLVQGEPLGSANIAITRDSRNAYYASAAHDLLFQHDLFSTGVVGVYPVGDNPNVGLDQPANVALTPDEKTVAVLEFLSNNIELLTDVSVMSSTKFIISGNQFSGLSLINLEDRSNLFTLYALNDFGQPLSADGLENPRYLDLDPHAQISLNVSELFNFDLSTDHIGRVLVYANQPRAAGYFSLGQIAPTWLSSYLNRMDGAPLQHKPLHDFVIPEIPADSGVEARLSFVNPNYSQATYDLKHYAKDGTLLEESADTTISGQWRTELLSSDLFSFPEQGKLLITGGQTSTSTSTTAASESYDPDTGAFSTKATMTSARQSHTATALVNGKVLLAGGKNGDTILASAETYDIAQNTYAASAGVMSVERQRHTATLLPSGKVLLAGGQSSAAVTDMADIYDPTTDSFSATSSNMTVPRDGHTATLLLNGKVLIVGGINGDNVSNTAELFDPATGLFSPTGSMAEARVFHTATRLANGRVLITGGYNGSQLSTAEIYDPATGTFRATAGGMGWRREHHTATLLSTGRVLIAGGSEGSNILVSAEIYDPAGDSFTAIAGTMITARSQHTATLLPDGQVLVAGGTDGSEVLSSCEVFDPGTQTFESASGMTTPRSEHAATLLVSSGGGYVRVASTQGLLFTEFYGRNNSTAAMNGIDVDKFSGVTRLYAPQFANTEGFRTILNLINANTEQEAQVTITLHGPDGAILAPPLTQTLVPNAQLQDDLNNIFLQDPAIQNTTGWLEIHSTADRVVGTVSFIDSGGTFLTSFELSGTPLSRFVLPMAPEDGTYQTGIAMLNSNDQAATVTMELWGLQGTLDSTRTLTLPSGARTALYLVDYFPGMASRLVGNIRIHSDQPLHCISLVNDRQLHFLAAAPAIPFPEE